MIVLLLLAVVGAGAFWAGKNSRSYPPAEISRSQAEQPARRQVVYSPAPIWPWVIGAAVLGVLLLGVSAGPAGLFGGPGVFAGLMGP